MITIELNGAKVLEEYIIGYLDETNTTKEILKEFMKIAEENSKQLEVWLDEKNKSDSFQRPASEVLAAKCA